MRDKKDSIFDSDILQKTAHLSHEEFGLFIRMAMIEDDEETQKRYENISGVFLNAYMKIEEQWKEDFKPYTEDIKSMSDYSVIYSSAAKSRKGYNQLKETLDNKKGNNGTNTTTTEEQEDEELIKKQDEEYENMLFDTKYFLNKKTYQAEYKIAQENNVPTENEMLDLKEEFNNETLIKLIEIGNKEKWQRHYTTILQELYEESKQKTETPFDCLKGDEE